MPQPAHHELEESCDVVVRFTNENACHEPSIANGQREYATEMV
jgi:hypothetical protein